MSKETVGPRIKAFRKGRGITQAQLAKDLGYSHKSVIAHIEKQYLRRLRFRMDS